MIGPIWFKSGETFGYNSFMSWMPCLNTTYAITKSDATKTDKGMLATQNLIVDSLAKSAAFRRTLVDHPAKRRGAGCPRWTRTGVSPADADPVSGEG